MLLTVPCKTKQILALFLLIGVFTLVAVPALSAQEEISIHIDGKVVASDVDPVIVKNRIMVPIRVISENLGREVIWDQIQYRVIIITPGKDNVTLLPINSPERGISIIIDGQELITEPGEPQPFVMGNRTMVPLRFIAEGLGMKVDWDESNRQVIITSPIKEEPVKEEPIEEEPTPPTNEDGYGEAGIVDNIDYEVTIMGEARMGRDELLTVMLQNNPAAPRELVDLYLLIGKEYGVRGDIAFCQAAKETGWWKYGGLVKPYQNNYCGLGATGTAATGQEDLLGADPTRVRYEEGVHGAIFADPATGVEAHIQHLYAYACKDPLLAGKVLVDPRFVKVTRGIAPRWVDLGGRWAYPGFDRNKYTDFSEAFAAYDTYGHSILRDYYQKVLDIAK